MNDVFDIESNDNVLFVTEQCNNRCLMCCQPPMAVDDIEYWYARNIELLRHAHQDLRVLGITGGEATLLGDRLVDLLSEVRSCLPNTAIHLLSNGRGFADLEFVKRVHGAAGDNFFVGIPLHSDYEGDHNMIAGARNAFEETLYGLYNLASDGVEIELRVVINKLNYQRLPQMADFIFKNLPFVSWTAFMGMEMFGLASKNDKTIWVEPVDYKAELREAVVSLNEWGMDACIYNIPLCLLDEKVWPFAKKSISDWKTKYLESCAKCSQKEKCCGLFSTSITKYVGISSK